MLEFKVDCWTSYAAILQYAACWCYLKLRDLTEQKETPLFGTKLESERILMVLAKSALEIVSVLGEPLGPGGGMPRYTLGLLVHSY
jgi:hypothetical protein